MILQVGPVHTQIVKAQRNEIKQLNESLTFKTEDENGNEVDVSLLSEMSTFHSGLLYRVTSRLKQLSIVPEINYTYKQVVPPPSSFKFDPFILPGIELYPYQCLAALKFLFHNCRGLVEAGTGCLDGGTLIDVPRDLNKSPLGIPISDLVGTFPWVYCYSHKEEKMVLAQASRVWKTGRMPVYKIEFVADRSRRKVKLKNSIITTGDHRFLLREKSERKANYQSGGYKPAQELKRGDRLMPFFRSLAQDDYSLVCLNNGETVYEHKYIIEQLSRPDEQEIISTPKWQGHHRNLQRLDNRVENLQAKTEFQHQSDHSKERHLAGKSGWQNSGSSHPKGMLGKNHSESFYKKLGAYRQQSRQEKVLRDPWRQKQVLLDLYCSQGLSSKEIAQRFGINAWNVQKELKLNGIQTRNNHEVKSVKFLGYRDVYDICVPEHHNFVANGVVVHNSGKTEIAIALCKYLDVQTVFFCDRVFTMEQTYERFKSYGLSVGRLGGGHCELSCKILVGVVDSLYSGIRSGRNNRVAQFIELAEFLVVDEAHHGSSRTWMTVLEHSNARYRLGMSASSFGAPDEVDFNDLRLIGLTGEIVCKLPPRWLIDNGTCKQCGFTGRVADSTCSKCGQAMRGYLAEPLVYVHQVHGPSIHSFQWSSVYKQGIVNNEERNQAIVSFANQFEAMGKKVLIIVDRHEHGFNLIKMLDCEEVIFSYGGGSVFRKSVGTGRKKFVKEQWTSERVRAQFNKRKSGIMIGSSVFDEGVDLPSMNVVILGAGGKSERRAIQRIGRTTHNKYDDFVFVVDFRDDFHPFTKKHSRLRGWVYQRLEYPVFRDLVEYNRRLPVPLHIA